MNKKLIDFLEEQTGFKPATQELILIDIDIS
jgi:hypothetical protein